MKKIVFLCVILATGVANAQTAADGIAALLRNIDTFSADFEQTLVSGKGQILQQVSGKLKAKKPGLFYWHTLPPLEQEIVTDGEQVWLYDPDLEQVTIQKLSKQLANTPALLLSGEVSDIESQYQVAEVTIEAGKQAFFLTPKNPDSLFDSLYLAFQQGQLSIMQLKDSLGQETILKFSGQQINSGVSQDDFHFEIPEGVDVIRE